MSWDFKERDRVRLVKTELDSSRFVEGDLGTVARAIRNDTWNSDTGRAVVRWDSDPSGQSTLMVERYGDVIELVERPDTTFTWNADAFQRFLVNLGVLLYDAWGQHGLSRVRNVFGYLSPEANRASVQCLLDMAGGRVTDAFPAERRHVIRDIYHWTLEQEDW